MCSVRWVIQDWILTWNSNEKIQNKQHIFNAFLNIKWRIVFDKCNRMVHRAIIDKTSCCNIECTRILSTSTALPPSFSLVSHCRPLEKEITKASHVRYSRHCRCNVYCPRGSVTLQRYILIRLCATVSRSWRGGQDAMCEKGILAFQLGWEEVGGRVVGLN